MSRRTLAVGVLAAHQAYSARSSALGTGRHLDLEVKGCVLRVGFAFGSGDVFDGGHCDEFRAGAVCADFTFVGASAVCVHLINSKCLAYVNERW